jgi:CRP-like cAMP-binding protein
MNSLTETELLRQAFFAFSGMRENEFNLSMPFWEKRSYARGEFYNEYKNVCRHMGFVLTGIFRAYCIDDSNGEEKNVFFFSPKQIIVSYKSFVTQTPCNYHTEAMTDAEIVYIHHTNLIKLYQQSHAWEKFGRLVAEKAFDLAMTRAESFLFLSPEERYRRLIEEHPDIFNTIPLYHIASYLDIKGPSLSRIRKRMMDDV